MKFRKELNLLSYTQKHEQIAREGLLNNLRAVIDRVIKNSKNEYAMSNKLELCSQLKKYDDFFTINQLFANDKITKALIKSEINSKKLRFPLKMEWIEIFENYGFKVNKNVCRLMYLNFSTKLCFRQYLKFFKNFLRGSKFVDFNNASVVLGTKPEHYVKGDLKNFGNWILNQIDKSEYSKIIIEAKASDTKNFIRGLTFIKAFEDSLFPYFKRNFLFLLFKLNKSLRIKLIYFKYPEITMQSLLVLNSYCNLPKTVFLASSLPWIKNPLFHFMELKGTKFIYINSSLAIDPKIVNDYANVNWCDFSEWKNIWCVNNIQLNFLAERKLLNNPKLTICGVPDWIDLPNKFQINVSASASKSLSIFDYEPHVSYFGYSSLNDLELSFEKSIIGFIDDITKIAGKYGFYVFHKSKRNIGRKRSKLYSNYLDDLVREKSNFISVDPDYSPRKMIKNTNATISIPFTSTNIIAIEQNKPTSFYDRNGKVSKDDLASSNSIVLLNLLELELWIKNLPL